MPRISDERLHSIAAGLLSRHRKHPEVSFSQHRLNRIAELAGVVLPRKRIYLDTRYWLFLRDAALGRPQKPIHVELLKLLRSGVQSGRLLCPIGDSTFFEILKQADASTRLATADVVDTLSLGVVIQNAADRLQTELVLFLASVIGKQTTPGLPVDRVWMKVGHVLGTPQPVFDGASDVEQLAISKAFFDVMWSVTLGEMLLDTPQPHDVADEDLRADVPPVLSSVSV